MFQPICLKTDLKDKYITISTSALIDLHITQNKLFYFKNCTNTQDEVWNSVFDFSKLKLKGHSFNYQIQTDGFAVSVNFIKNEDIEKKRAKNENKKRKAREAKQLRETKSDNEIKEIKKQQAEQQLQRQIASENKKKQMKEEFKQLSKQEQDKKLLEIRLKKNEFNYIGDLIKNNEFYERIKEAHRNNRLVYGDLDNLGVITPKLFK